jgi:hypothetical protein
MLKNTKHFILFILTLLAGIKSHAQMVFSSDTLYGNEWIKSDQSYFKFPISQDGLYRITYSTLADAGVPISSIRGDHFQLFRMGQEIPIFATTDSIFESSDYIEFYGERMKSELDRFLFNDPDNEMLNPDYSLINDTISYFLTWVNSANNNRLVNIQNDLNNVGTTEPYAMYSQLSSFPNSRIKYGDYNTGINSRIEEGEGYGTSISKTFNTSIQVLSINSPTDSVAFRFRIYTYTGSHNIDFKINDQSLGLVNVESNKLIDTVFNVPASLVGMSASILIQDNDPNTKGFSVSNINATFKRLWQTSGLTIFPVKIPTTIGDHYIELNGFYQGGPFPIVYDLKNKLRLVASVDNGITKIKLPGNGDQRNLIFCSGATIKSIEALEPVIFRDFNIMNADYVIISHKSLYDDGQGKNYINEYADYRAGNQGGNHIVANIEIKELYDQFAFGNDRNFISIRNFAHFIQKKCTLEVCQCKKCRKSKGCFE